MKNEKKQAAGAVWLEIWIGTYLILTARNCQPHIFEPENARLNRI